MTARSTEIPSAGAGRVAALVAGDVVALLVFAALGRRSHGEAAGVGALIEVGRTALPFIVGWLVAAPFAGAFDPARTRGLAPMLRSTLFGWAGGLLVGALMRALIIGRLSPASFYVVTFLVALLLLGGWRAAFTLVERKRTRTG